MGWFSKNRAYIELQEVIEAIGIKQSWVADRLGISAAYLSMLLNRKRRLTEEMENHFVVLVENIKGERR